MNNREPLFWSALGRARFMRVLNEARARYVTGPPKDAEVVRRMSKTPGVICVISGPL
ncbi:MAG: hypothetical protein LBK61_03045 [Spirochaetaceae bacterium]|nr:hypothetical protein [Spirochaetaceae bacterium]